MLKMHILKRTGNKPAYIIYIILLIITLKGCVTIQVTGHGSNGEIIKTDAEADFEEPLIKNDSNINLGDTTKIMK